MKRRILPWCAAGLLVALTEASAATLYVNATGTNPVPPFADWPTAAATIQDAVDAAAPGDEIVVTNGVYQTGARAVYGMSNRVAVTKPVTVRSVNGPDVTSIVGHGPIGDDAIRCVYLTNGAVLNGFTLTNGATHGSGGGVLSGGPNAMVSNCMLKGNSAGTGGGVYGGTLNNSMFTSNSAILGGGAADATLYNCTLIGNRGHFAGGGASGGTLNNCTLIGNWGDSGGGATEAALNNCTLTGNWAYYGGGASGCSLNHCTLTANSAHEGGGVMSGSADNCTITGNSAGSFEGAGGGAASATLNNCIIYHNSADDFENYSGCILNFSCTTPAPESGVGNITNEPAFVDLAGGNLRLQSNSPCINAGNNAYVTTSTDLDGRPRVVGETVDIGAFEWQGTTRYVSAASTNPIAPYSSWEFAAVTIQDAVDAAAPGDEIVVTNGVYQTGARGVYGMSNRVAVTKPVTVRSVNGPGWTSIVGFGPIGPTAIRCVYLTNRAFLAGFTLTNGATTSYGSFSIESGGGVSCAGVGAVVSNCVFTGNAAYFYGGGAYQGTVNNCTFTGNSAGYGGAVSSATLNNCPLTGNSAVYGGGARASFLNNCTLTGNSAQDGGGALQCALNNCTLTGNSASHGGGAISSTLTGCTLSGNWANTHGGGGAKWSTLNNCTLTGNLANGIGGGGTYESALTNCIVYYNRARHGEANYDAGSTFNYSCTTPLPDSGTGNRAEEPQLASTSHLSAGSPCIGRGNATYFGGTDLDGESWANPPSIGCDEYWSGSVTGALSVAVVAAYTNVAVAFAVDFQALIGGRVSASRWNFGDGLVVSNRPWASHAWATPGDYVVELRAYNESEPAGVAVTVTVHVVQDQHYVALANANPVPPYTSWATAATSIQDALDAVAVPGAVVWVSNGVYQTGARAVYGISNRVVVNKFVTVRSVNGPGVTSIVGSGPNGPNAVRCAYLTNGAVLAGFTLTNGATSGSGGGVWCESASAVVSNCTLTGNSASSYGGGSFGGTLNFCTLTGNSAHYGGGAYEANLDDCTLTGNSVDWYGGGAFQSALNNCTLAGNSSGRRGGATTLCKLTNCVAYFNSAALDGPNYFASSFSYSCTTPVPSGVGNITNAPLFVDTNGWSNLRLQSNSPCINAGNNAYGAAGTDLDGLPRVAGGTVDIGAHEFQSPSSKISYAWLQQFGLPTDGSADDVDTDHDRHNNWQEWMAGTDPTNGLSVLWLAAPVVTPTNVTLTWTSVSNRLYTVEQATNLGGAPAFSVLRSNLAGLPGTTSWTNTNAPVSSPRFYRLRVSP